MDPVLRALRYRRVPGVTIAQACARYGVTRAALNRARQTRSHEVRWTLQDVLLSALLDGGAHTAESLVEYVDWLEHARYAPAELERIFEDAAAQGLVRRTPAGWQLSADWP